MFSKYIIVGLVNTTITAAIIFILTYLEFNIYLANAIGYIAGIIISFILNSQFTFSTKLTLNKFIKFLLTCFICYLCNLITINIILAIQNEWIYFAQLSGMVIYTGIGFILNKIWVMK